MTIDLMLEQTSQSGPLVPSRLTQALAALAQQQKGAKGSEPTCTMRGQELRLALAGSLEDGACTGFLLDFLLQGMRVHGEAHGPSASALEWAFHALAAALKCTLRDMTAKADIEPRPDEHREDAVAYLRGYEAEVKATREQPPADEGRALLEWLAREEHVELANDEDIDELASALPLDDASALYEMLLENDAVDDIFVSESELTTLLARFRARTAGE